MRYYSPGNNGSTQAITGSVSTYADLPSAASHASELWAVLTDTGTVLLGTKKYHGVYRSDGSTWLFVSDLTLVDAASEITNDSSVSGSFVKDALNTLLAMFPVSVSNGGTGATTLTGLVKGNGTSAMTAVAAPSGAVVGTTDTQTLTNKRVTHRITTITSSATPTINTDNCDAVTITALATAITSMTTNLSGTPDNFDKLIIRIKDDGTARAITWGTSFVAEGATLPTTTTAGKVTTTGFIYDSVKAKWGCVVSVTEA